MKSEKVEQVLEQIKEYRSYDSNFMKIYREYKIDETTEASKEEVLTSLIEYLHDSGFISPYHEETEGVDMSYGSVSSSI